MHRDISSLTDNTFEVVVIGGGIHGATIFYQLAAAGMKVALLEKADFGSGTSANSLKILHGGLRYLQHLNIKRMRESINSRKYYMQMAPHLIEPMPCMVPTSGFGMKGKPVMGVAMKLFDIISWDRNRLTPVENRVGRGRLLSRQQCLRIGAGLGSGKLTGGALWYDDLITNTERMILTFIKAGVECGGIATNYVEVRKLPRDKNRITGAEVTDRLSGRTFIIQSNMIINAAGPWIDDIRKESHQANTTEQLAKAINIVVKKQLFAGHGVGLEGTEEFNDQDAKIKRSKRLFFFVPWKKRTIIGTTYSYYDNQCDELCVSPEEIREIIDEVNHIYPKASLTLDDVVFSHTGLMPAHKPTKECNATPQLIKHSRVIDHQQLEELDGLITVEGVKYTTAPAVAHQVERLLKKKKMLNKTAPPQISFAPSAKLRTAAQVRYASKFPHIPANYGRDSEAIFSIVAREGGGGNFITTNSPLIKAEVLYCVREEMAVKLSDVVLRRTECGSAGCPGEPKLREIAEIMAAELKWDNERVDKEVEQVLSHYRHTLNIPL